MTTTFDPVTIRGDFPALATQMRGHDLVYLDNGATSLKAQPVLDAVMTYYREYGANIHRGVYEMSGRATIAYDEARAAVRRFIGCQDDHGEVIFVSGATHGANVAAFGWGMENLSAGDEVVLTELEHHSNLVPWQQVAHRRGATVRYIPLTEGGVLTERAIEETIGERTKVVAITAMSNVTGYMPPLERIISRAKAV